MRCGLFTKQSDRSGVLSNSILTLCLHCASSRVFKVFVMARCVTWSSLIAMAFELKYGFRVFNRGNYKLIENILKDIKMSWRKKKKLSSAAIRQDRSHSIHLPPQSLKVTVKVFFWPWMMMKLEDNKEDGDLHQFVSFNGQPLQSKETYLRSSQTTLHPAFAFKVPFTFPLRACYRWRELLH